MVWYTTQIVSQLVRPVTAAFEKKYPGIKVRATRANATETAVKILNEAKAGRLQADIFDGTTTVVPLKAEGHVLQWLPDAAKDYPAQVKDPQGYWIANNLFVITPGFNTSLIPRGKQPRTLRRPARSVAARQDGVERLPDLVRRRRLHRHRADRDGRGEGHGLLRELGKQRIANLRGSAREVLDQTIAGEYSLALQIFNHHAVISAKKGAPVDWIRDGARDRHAVDALGARQGAASQRREAADGFHHLARRARRCSRRPTISPRIRRCRRRVPTLKPSEGKFRAHFFTPEETEEKMPKWNQVFQRILPVRRAVSVSPAAGRDGSTRAVPHHVFFDFDRRTGTLPSRGQRPASIFRRGLTGHVANGN